ncbi:formate/nitrite transporter family protein [Gramella sp. AN32]|uniref:Formate/nitrite transporter family protein n=1 Tax=Christiangramia antarctica TaxID=2058158 RepID=A0ABW5X0I6_9FLAO|nr:formate/nitrite transporter family protein [Gramella sp. AN32]MCM4156820.1 formate transporter [Gramella sp. AN32]
MDDKKNQEKEKQKKEKQDRIDHELDKKGDESTEKDETTDKSHGDILKEQIMQGCETYDRSGSSIFLSSITAGLEIGFSFLMILALFSFLEAKLAEDVIFKLISLVYPLGFILVILGQSILFTEQTALLTLPVLNKKRSIYSLFKIWGIVIFGNLIGGMLIAFTLIWLGPRLDIFDEHAIAAIGEHVVDFPLMTVLVSGILAGWLMGLLSWLLTSAKDTVSQIIMIFLITGMMAFTGLHHSIIGNIEIFAGMLVSSKISFTDYVYVESMAILGNAIGGAVFVALLKYRAFVFNVKMP